MVLVHDDDLAKICETLVGEYLPDSPHVVHYMFTVTGLLPT
jgi:hypothetical protein